MKKEQVQQKENEKGAILIVGQRNSCDEAAFEQRPEWSEKASLALWKEHPRQKELWVQRPWGEHMLGRLKNSE